MSEETHAPSSVARAIEDARVAQAMSIRRAAELADMSEGRWRQIAKGFQQMAGGFRAPVNAPPETLARMSSAVRLSSEDLRRAVRAQGDLGDLVEEVATALEQKASLSSARMSVFGGTDDLDYWQARAEEWFWALQDRIESLELEVEDLRSAVASPPNASSQSDGGPA